MKKLKIIIPIIIVLSMLAGGGYYWWTGTPQYSLFKLKEAIIKGESNDALKYIDVDAIFESFWSEMTAEALAETQESDSLEGFGALLGIGFMESLKPALKEQTKQAIIEGIENPSGETTSGGLLGALDKKNTDLDIDVNGKLANIKIDSGTSIVMKRQEERYWKIIEIDGLLEDLTLDGDGEDIDGEISNAPEVIEVDNKISCPDFKKIGSLSFNWADDTDGNDELWLNADFFRPSEFVDGWVLDELPSTNQFISDSLHCERGSVAGESINKLYCRPTYMYRPTLKKNEIDEGGDILKTDYLYVDVLVFDIKDVDIRSIKALGQLRIEFVECTD